MRIHNLIIKNIRSFKEETILSFDPHFNMLIGPNGGGKSNLFDIIALILRNYFLDSYTMAYYGPDKALKSAQKEERVPKLDKFIGNESAPSIIKVSFTISEQDLQNIRIIKKHQKELEEILNTFKYRPMNDLNFVQAWNESTLRNKGTFYYHLEDGKMLSPDPKTPNLPESMLLQYLQHLELFLFFARQIPDIGLHPTLLHFLPIRSPVKDHIRVSLSAQNYYDILHEFHMSTSQDSSSLLKLATYYFSVRKRRYQDAAEHTGYVELWDKDPEVSEVNKALESLGYEDWMPVTVDVEKNLYEIKLRKDNVEYLMSQASSGEKEILNFLVGTFGFRIHGGIIIVDEPEIHLHPKWQRLLYELLLSTARKLDCQLIISTHSETFISLDSIRNAKRVYKHQGSSRVINVVDADRDQQAFARTMALVKSMLNERIFFADRVVLTLGTVSTHLFRRLIEDFSRKHHFTDTVEVVDVGSTEYFALYQTLLSALKMQHFSVTGFDYITTAFKDTLPGPTPEFLHASFGRLSKEEQAALLALCNEAISTHHVPPQLSRKWHEFYFAPLFRKTATAEKGNDVLRSVIADSAKRNIFILNKGDISAYFSKSVPTIETLLTAQENELVLKTLADDSLPELMRIVQTVCS